MMSNRIARHLSTHSAAQTRRLGRWLGQHLQAGDVVGLGGDLGTGKTTFAAGLGQGWGIAEPLTSPTYVIVRRYTRPADGLFLHHLDAYRLASADDVESIALEDILDAPGVVVIEWAEHLRQALPQDMLWLTLSASVDDPDARDLLCTANGPRSRALLHSIEAADVTRD